MAEGVGTVRAPGMDTKDLLKPPAPVPVPKKKPATLGAGDPECGFCEGPLGDDGFCPTCDHTDLDTEIDL